MMEQVAFDQRLARVLPLPGPRERQRLGRSVWLLLLLCQWQGPSDGYVRSGNSIRAQELAEGLGIGERQARRELQRLRRAGYVELQNTGRGFKIRLPRWRTRSSRRRRGRAPARA